MIVVPDVRGFTPTTKSRCSASRRPGSTRSPSTSSGARREPGTAATASSTRMWRRPRPPPPGRHRRRGGVPAFAEGGQVRAFAVGFCFGGAGFPPGRQRSRLQRSDRLLRMAPRLPRWPDRPKPIETVSRFRAPATLWRRGSRHLRRAPSRSLTRPSRGGRPARVDHVRRRAAQLLRPEAGGVRRRLRRCLAESAGLRDPPHPAASSRC